MLVRMLGNHIPGGYVTVVSSVEQYSNVICLLALPVLWSSSHWGRGSSSENGIRDT